MALSKITNSGIGAIDTLTVDTNTLYVDSTNNRVGVGTISPQDAIHIAKASAVLRLEDTDTNHISTIQSGGSGLIISADAANTVASSYMAFNVDTTERLRIDSSGGISTSANKSGGYALGVFNDGNNSDRYGISIQCGSDSGSGTNYLMGFKDGDGNSVGSITFSGSSTSFNTSSDYRLKENVTADWDATTRLKQLNPVRFNFIADADTTLDGFLAHEVQSVVPEAIAGTHNEVDADGNPVYQGIDQSKLVPLLVKTIQELEARIAALENA